MIKQKTLTIGNSTITSQDIAIIGVDKIFDIGCNQYIHSVDIQTASNIVNEDTGCIDVVYNNYTYPCAPDEYEKYKHILEEGNNI
jgi:hypothetical protein